MSDSLLVINFLNYDEFNFRTSIPPDEENQIFKMISDASIMIMVSYIFVLASAIVFVRSVKINLRENPWFLMCCILFFAFVPVELYTSFIDIKFALLLIKDWPIMTGCSSCLAKG
ncbi:MAG: hypothetical protein R3A12_00725 [Ignavibacteria bacterium]